MTSGDKPTEFMKNNRYENAPDILNLALYGVYAHSGFRGHNLLATVGVTF